VGEADEPHPLGELPRPPRSVELVARIGHPPIREVAVHGVAEWRAWAVDSGRAKAEDVKSMPKGELQSTFGAAYDRDREAQLQAETGSDEGGSAPRKGDAA
jgi:hypothetical protein